MKKGTWVLLAVVLAFVAAILLWERRQPSTAEREENKLKPFTFKKEDVKSAVRTGQAPVSLKKDAEGEWQLTGPVADKADRYGMEGFLERISGARAVRWVEGGADAKDLGLNSPRAAWELKGDRLALRIEVGGKAAFDEGLYVRAGNKIALLPSDLESLLLSPISEFRSKELTRVATQDVKSLAYRRSDGTEVAFQRVGEEGWNITVPFRDWGAAEKIKLLVDDVSICPVFGFAEDKPSDLRRYGLDHPERLCRIGLAKEKTVEVRLGSAVPGTAPKDARVYAWTSDRPSVMIVSLNSLKSLEQDPEGLRSLALFKRDLFGAQSVEVSGLYAIRELRDDKGAWNFGEPKPPPAGSDPSVLPSELVELRGEKIVAVSDPAALGLVQPDLTVTVKGKNFEEKAVIGVEKEGRRYAQRTGRAAALLLPKEDWTRIEEALKLVTGRGKHKSK